MEQFNELLKKVSKKLDNIHLENHEDKLYLVGIKYHIKRIPEYLDVEMYKEACTESLIETKYSYYIGSNDINNIEIHGVALKIFKETHKRNI